MVIIIIFGSASHGASVFIVSFMSGKPIHRYDTPFCSKGREDKANVLNNNDIQNSRVRDICSRIEYPRFTLHCL
jgi:hypothetical protein